MDSYNIIFAGLNVHATGSIITNSKPDGSAHPKWLFEDQYTYSNSQVVGKPRLYPANLRSLATPLV